MANIQNHPQAAPNANVAQNCINYAEVIGGISFALISGLAIGIIFGPLAAIAAICCGGIIGAYAGLKISSCFSKNEPSVSEIQLRAEMAAINQQIVALRQAVAQHEMTLEQEREIDRLFAACDRSLAETTRLSLERDRLNAEYDEIRRNNQQIGMA